MASNGELYVRVLTDNAVVGTPRQIVDNGFPVTGVIVNNVTMPAGIDFKICRKGASDGVRMGAGDALTDIFCPPLMDGLYCYFTPAVPGGVIELVVLSGSGQVTRG